MDRSVSSGGDTLAGDTVIIQVPADGPYGINLRPDENGNAAVIHSFDKLPNGKFGPIQKHGGVHYGDVLCEINDTSLSSVSYAEAVQMLSNRNTLKKILKFQSPKVYYRKKNTMSYRSQPADGKNTFLSAVKRSRISEVTSKKFIEYEIACQYRLVGNKVQTEVVYQWSVWKRYSEFEALHAAVKKSLGWQMDGIELPSARTFVLNKLAPEFVDQRREDLKEYWQKVTSIDKVMDFAKHHCSNDIKLFLQIDDNTRNKNVAATADMLTTCEDAEGVGEERDLLAKSRNMSPTASGAPSRRGSVRMNSRRMSAKTIGAVNATLAIGDAPSSSSTTSSVPITSPVSSTVAVTVCSQEPAAASPPPPPPRPAAAMTPPPPPRSMPPPVAATSSTAAAGDPPKTAARANLLGAINALRKD